MGLTAISEFSGAFSEKGYEQEIKTGILANCSPFNTSLLQLGRLRTAWTTARADLNKVCRDRQEGNPEAAEWDAPLGEADEAVRKAEFDGAYDGLRWEVEHMPLATITGRFFREFRSSSRIITNYALGKVRSEAFCRGDPAGTRHTRDLGGGMSLNFQYEHVRRLPELSFTSIAQVLTSVNLLTKAWASAGACIVDSKQNWNHARNAPDVPFGDRHVVRRLREPEGSRIHGEMR